MEDITNDGPARPAYEIKAEGQNYVETDSPEFAEQVANVRAALEAERDPIPRIYEHLERIAERANDATLGVNFLTAWVMILTAVVLYLLLFA